jgi:hypothetical protein
MTSIRTEIRHWENALDADEAVVGDYIVFSCDNSTHLKRMEEKNAETRGKGSDSSKRQ